MFKKLPEDVQNEIKRHLMSNEFIMAKVLYDSWMASCETVLPAETQANPSH